MIKSGALFQISSKVKSKELTVGQEDSLFMFVFPLRQYIQVSKSLMKSSQFPLFLIKINKPFMVIHPPASEPWNLKRISEATLNRVGLWIRSPFERSALSHQTSKGLTTEPDSYFFVTPNKEISTIEKLLSADLTMIAVRKEYMLIVKQTLQGILKLELDTNSFQLLFFIKTELCSPLLKQKRTSKEKKYRFPWLL